MHYFFWVILNNGLIRFPLLSLLKTWVAYGCEILSTKPSRKTFWILLLSCVSFIISLSYKGQYLYSLTLQNMQKLVVKVVGQFYTATIYLVTFVYEILFYMKLFVGTHMKNPFVAGFFLVHFHFSLLTQLAWRIMWKNFLSRKEFQLATIF